MMYTPASFALRDTSEILSVLRQQSFGALVCRDEQNAMSISHLPILVTDDLTVVRTHMARANQQWKVLESLAQEVVMIVQGAHHAIAASWYDDPDQVGTWNYVVAHVYGHARLIHDADELLSIVEDLSVFVDGEQARAQIRSMDSTKRSNLLKAIVGVEIKVSRIDAKAKMSQNRTAEQRQRVLAKLDALGSSDAASVAELVRRYNKA